VDRIGFRTIETRGEDILLNGKRVFLRGISLHDENP
jgi:beta-glucuronidase